MSHKIVQSAALSDKALSEIDIELRESEALQWGEKCIYLAPYICFQKPDRGWHIVQGCCNHWDCPRCGHIRAREEYARIVEGAKTIESQGEKMYFWTLTCRGKELPLAEAEKGYMTWTNKLFTTARYHAGKEKALWCYVQVTERQKRLHPHSHLISTYCPGDAATYRKGERLPNGRAAKSDTLWSEKFIRWNSAAGLGTECQISAVRSAVAVATYISKYLFKDAMNTEWPPGWKRVRYSQSWPKLPEVHNPTAFPVITWADWHRVWDLREPVRADTVETYRMAVARGVPNVILPTWNG